MSDPQHDPQTLSPQSSRYWGFLFFLLAMGVGGLLFFALDAYPGLNGDEAYQGLLSAPMGDAKQDASTLWRMLTTKAPSGRYPHPLLASSVYALERVYAPSAWTLRFPVALWSLLACLLLFVLARRLADGESDALAPWTYLLIFASHPMFLGYARFAWEPSLYVVGGVLFWMPWFFGAAFRARRLFWGMIVLGAVLLLLAHPVYLVFLICAVSVLWWRPRTEQALSRPLRQRVLFVLWVCVLGGGLIWALVQAGPSVLGRFFVGYLFHLVEIFSGMRVFQYITGISWSVWHGLLLASFSWLVLMACIGFLGKDRKELQDHFLFFGLCFFCYFFLQPILPITVGQERYILVLLFPFAFFLAAGLQRMPLVWRRITLALHTLICLVSFTMGYFVQGWETENRFAHPTFWVGSGPQDAEPKAKIARWIKAQVPPQTPIYTSNFWMEKSLAHRLQRPIKMYWDTDTRSFLPIPWDKIPRWVVVDFHLRESPLWPLMRHLDHHKIPYQKYTVKTQKGRTQAWMIMRSR